MKHLFVLSALAVSAVGMSQVWNEVGDAADGPSAFQDTIGTGSLNAITGRLDRGAGDHVDTYCFTITSQSQFFATTKISFGGSAVTGTGSNADTRLWLWNANGGLMLANDDVNDTSLGSDTLASFISDPSTYNSLTNEVVDATAGAVVLTPGTYMLSISLFSNDPEDAANVDLANFGSDFDALHGQATNAGGFDHWENGASTTVVDYTIAMRGVEYCSPVPEPATMSLLALGGLAAWRRRRAK